MGDDDAGLDAETLELAGLLHDFGRRWHVYRVAGCWEAEARPPPANASPVIRKATVAEMRAALEILDGRLR
jgi:hypothetical protein